MSKGIFEIEWVALPYGKTVHSFQKNDTFLKAYPNNIVSDGSISAEVELEKSETLLTADISIDATVELTCDRSSVVFMEPLRIQERVIFKLGEKFEELDDTLFEIDKGLHKLILDDILFNQVLCAIPMKKIHPDLRSDEYAKDAEGNLLIYQPREEEILKGSLSQKEDSPFNVLLKLKNLN